jgi:hypothetical protein
MSFIEHYETQLVEAGRRRIERRLRNRIARRLRPPRRRNAAIVLAVLLVGAPATAATVGWNPFDSPDRKPGLKAPTTSRKAPDRALTSLLAPLRRPQTPADRGRASDLAARGFWDDVSGVQLDYIRLLDPARGIVLVPVERFGLDLERNAPGPTPNPAFFRNAVCLYIPSGAVTARRPCYGAMQIRDGFALGSTGGVVVGLVPDGVARVRLARGNRTVGATVRDNLFVSEPAVPLEPMRVEWLDAGGATVKRIDLTAPPPP